MAFIPARGGSKGLPGKNIRNINGKPLLAWSIEAANRSDSIDEVYVSTDSIEIAEVARSFGAKVPYIRPAEISNDTASTESAVMHFVDWSKQQSLNIQNLILMQATSPFRHVGSIDRAMQKFLSEKADSLVTVCKTHKFFWRNALQPNASYDIYQRPRRQDILSEDEVFYENGSFYITSLAVYEEIGNRLGGKISLFEMRPEESFEIDDLIDFKIVELLMKEFGVSQ